MSLSLSVDPSGIAGVNRWFSDLDKGQAKANRRALLKGGKKAVSLSVKEVSARVGIKQKIIRRRLKAFAAPRKFLGGADFVRIWLGMAIGITARDDKRILRKWPVTFEARMKSGHVGIFARRPNPLTEIGKVSGVSSHRSPTLAGNPNPKRHGLPIDEVRQVLDRAQMRPIIYRHARASLEIYEAEFRRLLEVIARRAARKA